MDNNNHEQPPPSSAGDANIPNSSSSDSQSLSSSFVVFQQSGRESENNIVYSLPHSLRTAALPRPQTTQPQSQPQPQTSDTNNANSDSTNTAVSPTMVPPAASTLDRQTQRNMYVSVTYMYTQAQVVNADTPEERVIPVTRTGTILLTVPDIPANRTDSEIGQLVEFAASIALGAIAAHGWTRTQGIKVETFEKFPVLTKDQIQDHACPICFEDYIIEGPASLENEVESSQKSGDKRKRASGDSELLSSKRPAKKARLSNKTNTTNTSGSIGPNDEPSTSSASASASASTFPSSTRALSNLNPLIGSSSHSVPAPQYKHVAVKLPCAHVFGRDCLYEWLKTKNSCPLCRKVVHTDTNQGNVPDRVTVPDIESFLSPSTRDRPMVVNFDRDALTLTALPPALPAVAPAEAPDAQSQEAQSPFRSLRRLRNEEVRHELQNLNNINTDSLFPAGVISRRAERGSTDVVTAESLFEQLNEANGILRNESESSRLIRERILQRLEQRRNQIMIRLRGRDTSNNSGQRGNSATQEEMDILNELGTITETDNADNHTGEQNGANSNSGNANGTE